MTITEKHSPKLCTPIHRWLTFPSNKPHNSTPLLNLHEKLQKLYHAFHSVLRTTSKTRETNFPQTYSHAIPYYPTTTQLDMQKTPFHFQILALDYTDDLYLYSRAIKATNPYVLWFENKLHFMCLQFNFIKLNKLDNLNVPNKIIKVNSTKSS